MSTFIRQRHDIDMREIQEHEAIQLLSRPLRCADMGAWKAVPGKFDKSVAGAGLMDEHGQRTDLTVELRFRVDPKHGSKVYVFSVFKRNRYGMERVYQLEINQTRGIPPDQHSRPHEHFGNHRRIGPDKWMRWKYDELLRYFCARTKIDFLVPPADPSTVPRRKK